MARSPSRDPEPPAPAERAYHHGDLRRALLDETVRLIEEQGLDAVSVRELARRLGVSPGAPFRHFENRMALLTAVAEEAQERLVKSVGDALRHAADADPLQRFRAIGIGFLRWAIQNPTHFAVISNRAVIDFERPSLRERNDVLRATMRTLLADAASQGLLRSGDLDRLVLAARALSYGLARMLIDGQFPSWGLNEAGALNESVAVLDQFIASLAV